MNKASKIWLVIALVLCVCTTAMNAMEGRLLSAGIAVVSIACMCVLLFTQKKAGFYGMCLCAVASFVVGSAQSIQMGTGVLLSVVMSLIGSALVPGITGLLIKSQWAQLK